MENPQIWIHASQMQTIHLYKKWKDKVLAYIADIFFTTQCLANKIVPNSSKVKVPTHSPPAVKAKNYQDHSDQRRNKIPLQGKR